MSDLVGGFACNGCGYSCAYAQGIGYYCTNHKCTYERDQAKAMVEKMHRVADNAGTLEARITELETERIGLLQANLEANTQLARVTLKKRNLETALVEAEGRVIAEVVAWLRAGAGYKDGHIGPGTIVHYEKLATALETGEWKK